MFDLHSHRKLAIVVAPTLLAAALLGQFAAAQEPASKPGAAAQAAPAAPAAPTHSRADGDPDARARIERALEETTKAEFLQAPLSGVIAHFQKVHNITIVPDRKGLEDLGVGLDTPVTKTLEGISLKSALRIILQDHELAFAIDDGMLVITSKTVADTKLSTVVYDVGDLVRSGDDPPDDDDLIDLIIDIVQPPSWEDAGGPGSIVGQLETLVVSNTDDVHDEIVALLADIRAARTQQAAAEGAARYAPIRRVDAAAAKIEEKLTQRIDLQYDEEPLSNVLASLRQRLGIPIVADPRALADVGVDASTPVTIALSGVPARAALIHVFGELEMDLLVENEVLYLTSKTVADIKLVTRVYPVGDLLGSESDPDYDSLIWTITTIIAAASWEDAGGPGSIKEFEPAKCLAVSTTGVVHGQIESLMAAMRKSLSARERQPQKRPLETKVYCLPNVAQGDVRPSSEELKKLLLETVKPESWQEKGGAGEIRALTGALVIKQTRKVHDAVFELLWKFNVVEDYRPPRGSGFGPGGGVTNAGGGTGP